MRIEAAITGNLHKFMEQQKAAAEAAVTAGVAEVTERIKNDLRGQVTGAGLGNKLAKSWQAKLSPPAFTRIAAINAVRAQYPCLRHGRQYLRPISLFGRAFDVYGPGELIAWSRILDDEELLCVVNGHGADARGADVLVDASLSPSGSLLQVVMNTAQAGCPLASGAHPVGSSLVVKRSSGGMAFVEIRNLPPSEVLVLANHPQPDPGDVLP